LLQIIKLLFFFIDWTLWMGSGGRWNHW